MGKRKTTEEFIMNSKLVHNDKYDYSKTVYTHNDKKVCIICPIHGEFWQTPKNHLKKHGCPQCAFKENSKRFKGYGEKFIIVASEKFNKKYDYSKVNYKDAKTKVCIICPIHGEFWQTPNSHLKSNKGCPKCANAWNSRERMTTSKIIKRFYCIHGNKYDYSKVNYVNAKTNIIIKCPIHGELHVRPYNFLYRGCTKCIRDKKLKELSKIKKEYKDSLNKENIKKILENKEKRRKNNAIKFIETSKNIHNNKYDYSKVDYNNSGEKVCIICPEHGEFWQLPSNHIKGRGCIICGKKSMAKLQALTTDEFIKKAIRIHGDKYDYSKVKYINAKSKVCIICPEHGEFWQKPDAHLSMNGCQECARGKQSKEYILKRQLQEHFNKIEIKSEKRFKWLGKQRIDIYLEEYNIGIEYQGIQHFHPIEIFGGVETFKKQRENDIKKHNLCIQHDIKLFYFSFDKYEGEFPYPIIYNINELKKEIEKTLK